MPAFCFVILMASFGEGLSQLFGSGQKTSPLIISIIWAIYNAIPPFLVLWYAMVGKGVLLQFICRLAMLASFACGAAAVGLLWGLYPKVFDFNEVIFPLGLLLWQRSVSLEPKILLSFAYTMLSSAYHHVILPFVLKILHKCFRLLVDSMLNIRPELHQLVFS